MKALFVKIIYVLTVYCFLSFIPSNVISQNYSLFVGGGLDYNISQKIIGSQVVAGFQTKKIESSLHYSNFNASKIIENYYGISAGYKIVSSKNISAFTSCNFDLNVWSNFARFNGSLAKNKTFIISPSFKIAYAIKPVAIFTEVLYNLTWNEFRNRTGIYFIISPTNKADKKSKTYPVIN